ncbi:hypothetical protein HID58_065679 [Brassica napus]|uniref:RRM domain-containing protein n=1 Tax=Brassica napus TaxID=3708 RepID=A0ABQ7ZDH1_BRANA|nr:hypothetical protein HID58_065679 [Brassica napus]
MADTTYTKVFVGGLAWETDKDTMKKHFEQFGEILEAVVITDKASGRSKGYGFTGFGPPPTFTHYSHLPLNLFGYSYSSDFSPFPTNLYGVYGCNSAGQYGLYGNGNGVSGGLTAAAASAAPFYPCGGGQGGVQFSQPQPFYHHFSAYDNPHHYSPATISLQQATSHSLPLIELSKLSQSSSSHESSMPPHIMEFEVAFICGSPMGSPISYGDYVVLSSPPFLATASSREKRVLSR